MLTRQQHCDIANAVKPDELARLLVERLPDEAQVRVPVREIAPGVTDYNFPAINSEYVPVIAECLQEIVAYTVSTLIDAGSERDAVMENEDLAQELEAELSGWTEKEAHVPAEEN